MNNLPEKSYTISPITNEVKVIFRGENCFFHATQGDVEKMNEAIGVTPAQAAAMLGGVQHGWESDYADPAHYTVDGYYKGGL